MRPADSNDVTRRASLMRRLQATFGDAACVDCGTDDVRVLNARGLREHEDVRSVRCYECDSKRRGRTGCEEHHLIGRARPGATVILSANLHRRVTIAANLHHGTNMSVFSLYLDSAADIFTQYRPGDQVNVGPVLAFIDADARFMIADILRGLSQVAEHESALAFVILALLIVYVSMKGSV